MLRSRLTRLITILVLCYPVIANADRDASNVFTVVIEKPYIDLRTGPARAYPAFYIAQRGQNLEILKRRTHWFKVRLNDSTHRTIEGWVKKNDLYAARVAGSDQLARNHHLLQHDYQPQFSGNLALGRFEGADLISLQLGYHRLDVLSAEINFGSYTGINNQGWLVGGQLVYEPFYQWRLSPFVNAGYGYVKREQSGTLVRQDDESDHYLNAGLGLKLRIHKLYRLRFEYQVNNTLTETNDNRELELWQIGLSTYF